MEDDISTLSELSRQAIMRRRPMMGDEYLWLRPPHSSLLTGSSSIMPSNSSLDSNLDDEVEFVRETRVGGTEVITLSDTEEDTYGAAKRPIDLEEPFRLMDLPAELRLYVYQFLLPHNLNITFEWKGNYPGGKAQFDVFGSSKTGDSTPFLIKGAATVPRYYFSGSSSAHGKRPARPRHPRVETQLFRIDKAISNEARAVLYGSNTFKFLVDGSAHFPVSLRSPQIFGPFGDEVRLPLLRNLRSIHIDFLLDNSTHWAVQRQRSRLEYFVEILKEHADDENRKSLLQELKVEVRLANSNPYTILPPRFPPRFPYRAVVRAPDGAEKYMFSLEGLASLRGIKDVEIMGLPEWYTNCLQTCIRGKGGDVSEVNWPIVEVKRRRGRWSTTTKRGWVTTRKWYQPTLNWKEYAERNKIETPKDIEKYWVAKD